MATPRLCTLCARGGSKGVPGKNLRPLLGKPLIAWTLEQARESGLFALIAVSSDSPEILEAAGAHGADLLVERPAALASDSAGKLPAITHCIETAEAKSGQAYDVTVDLDATSPLRSVEDIRQATELLEERGVTSVVTGAPSHRSPYFNLVERGADGVLRVCKPLDPPLERRQDAPPCFDLNASIYVWRRGPFLAAPAVFYPDTLLYEMPPERSHDIDSELDFELVEFLMKRAGRA